MPGEQIQNLFFAVLRIYHWIMFFIVIEMVFCIASWMIFGGLGVLLDATLGSWEHEVGHEFQRFFGMVGKVVGVLGGIATTRFAMARYPVTGED